MAVYNEKFRVLIFIGSLRAGGKERRLIELLGYLSNKGSFEFMVVLTSDEIHYPDFFKLEIPYKVIKKKRKRNDPNIFLEFYRICKIYNPDIIHSWGSIQSFYSLPAVVLQNVPLINSQITSAPPGLSQWSISKLIDRLNFYFSKIILSNSKAGIRAYNPPREKSKVIYNGINLNRFVDLPSVEQVKSKYKITTLYTIIMSASFSPNKDYDLFYRIAKRITELRDDITFIGVGASHDDAKFNQLVKAASGNGRILFPGRIQDVEALVNACDIGILFSNTSVHGEGISNSILEYMTLSKPVIANDAGGTKELILHNENGYLITSQTEQQIVEMILELIDNPAKQKMFGDKSKSIIEEKFSLEQMGRAFVSVYMSALDNNSEVLLEMTTTDFKSKKALSAKE